MRLRPHHLYCQFFSHIDFSNPPRGKAFHETRAKMKAFFEDPEGELQVNEGPDMICQPCPYFNGELCIHPNGGETGVRKWDARVLQGTGLEYGQLLKVKELKSLIKQKAPLGFCLTRCSYYRNNRCEPGEMRE
ncbi:MAG: DUF1284 domain-containing protein [Chloroflexi bacterium]|nr:DUF1284 domain-containing protein [Chloroflexota bacterium]